MREDTKQAREKAAELLTKANELAQKVREAAEGERAEAEQTFDRAFAEYKEAHSRFQALENADTVEKLAREAAEESQEGFRRFAREAGVKDSERLAEAHGEVFRRYLAKGKDAAMELATSIRLEQSLPAEAFALLTVQDDLGGILAPEDFRAEYLKNMAGFAVVRAAGARVVPTGKSELVFPTIKANSGTYSKVYTSGFSGTWRREGAQGTDGTAPSNQSQPTFGEERIPVHAWEPDAVVLTEELLEDAVVPVDSIIAELIAETKALDEDYAFLNGTGVGQPLGMLNSSLTSVNSGHASLLKYNGLLDLYADLPAQYRQNAKFIMSSATFAAILKLENTGGFNLFPANQLPGQILGKQVYFSEFMPAVGANTYPIIFGDFRHFVIAERADLRLKRLVERFAPNVAIMAKARVGGKVVRSAAFRTQKVAA